MDKKEKQRTIQQNKALHKFFELLSDECNDQGITIQKLLQNEIDTMVTPILVKEAIWRPIQKVMFGKDSTTELTTKEIDQIFDVLNKHLGEWGIHIDFPSFENLMKEKLLEDK
jgi:hypothetical protein